MALNFQSPWHESGPTTRFARKLTQAVYMFLLFGIPYAGLLVRRATLDSKATT